MLVMEYASGGDLLKYLQNNFTNITWNKKINILSEILLGYLYFKYTHYVLKISIINFFFYLDFNIFIVMGLYIETSIVETY
jgi:hypothetical protein